MTHAQRAELYNELLDVRDASRKVQSDTGRAVLETLLTAIAAHGLQNRFGIRLLHKHNDLRDGEWMRESLRYDEDGAAIVTTAEEVGVTARPNSWQISAQDAFPIEYSDAELLVPPTPDDGKSAGALFSELGDILDRSGFADVLGPCVLYSDSVERLKPTDSSALLEKTDKEERSNILRFVPRNSVDFSASVETKWSAHQAIDESGSPIWLATCTCFCSVSPNGGHLGTTAHRYGTNEEPSKSE